MEERQETKRFVLFPIELEEIWKRYKELEHESWISSQFINNGINDWISTIPPADIGLFMACIEYMNNNPQTLGSCPDLMLDFIGGFQFAEIRSFYGWELKQEMVHMECFQIIESMGPDNHEGSYISNIPFKEVYDKYIEKWMPEDCSIEMKLLTHCISRYVFFSGIFAIIKMIGIQYTRQMLKKIKYDRKKVAETSMILFKTFFDDGSKSPLIHEMIEDAMKEEKIITRVLLGDNNVTAFTKIDAIEKTIESTCFNLRKLYNSSLRPTMKVSVDLERGVFDTNRW